MTTTHRTTGRHRRTAEGSRPLARLVLGAALLPALFVPLLAGGGCGYTTRALVPDRYRTISVDIFTNETRRHDLQFELTRAVVEEIQARTHLTVVPRDQPHDLVLRGSITDVDEDVASRRGFQRIRESDVFVTAKVEVLEASSNTVVAAERKVTEREAFVPIVGEDARTARSEAVRALAERIVRTLETGW